MNNNNNKSTQLLINFIEEKKPKSPKKRVVIKTKTKTMFKDCPIYNNDDEWYTPKEAWENINKYIPKDKVIWEGFGNPLISKSADYLRELGCNVIATNENFLKVQYGDCLITNPPFNQKALESCLKKMKKTDQPFILILPTTKLHTKYFRKYFNTDNLQLIIPRKKIEFYKVIKGEVVYGKACSFYSLYVCYKMNLPKDIIFIEG